MRGRQQAGMDEQDATTEAPAEASRMHQVAKFAAIATIIAGLAVGFYLLALWLRERTIRGSIDVRNPIIYRCAEEFSLPADLIRAVIRVESKGDAEAVSPRGAKGLMQVTDETKQEVRRRLDIEDGDLFRPEYNLYVGSAYLRMMIDRFGGDVYLALAAYNMGPTRLARMLRENPDLTGRQVVERFAPKETRDYCRKVYRHLDAPLDKLPVTSPPP
jgi:soluble lytic murein transglycosylase-like protein